MEGWATAVTISGTLFQSNISQGNGNGSQSENWGGGLFVNGTTVTLSDCVFRQNVAVDGGGMEDEATGTTTLTHCTFDTNRTLEPNGGNGNNAGLGGFGGGL